MSAPSDELRWHSHRRYLYLLAKVALFSLAAVALWLVARAFAQVLQPVLLSLLIAYLLDPLIDWFEARRISRTVAITGVALVVLLATGGLLLVVAPIFAQQFTATMHKLPTWFDGVWAEVATLAHDYFGYSSEELEKTLKSLVAGAQATVLTTLSKLGRSIDGLVNALLVPIFVFYFLRDFDTLKVKPLVLIPPRFRDPVIDRARHVDAVVGRWVRGQVEVALVLAVLYAVGLTLAGVRLGGIIGTVAGLLNVVPYFGAGIGILLSVLMVLVEQGGVRELIPVGITFVVVQVLEGYVITPRLVGSKVGMSPVAVILALLVGGTLFGLLGLVLAVPACAALMVLGRDALASYQSSVFYRGDATSGPTARLGS